MGVRPRHPVATRASTLMPPRPLAGRSPLLVASSHITHRRTIPGRLSLPSRSRSGTAASRVGRAVAWQTRHLPPSTASAPRRPERRGEFAAFRKRIDDRDLPHRLLATACWLPYFPCVGVRYTLSSSSRRSSKTQLKSSAVSTSSAPLGYRPAMSTPRCDVLRTTESSTRVGRMSKATMNVALRDATTA